MVLRALREPRTGQPSPLARLLAVLVVLGMVGISAPVLFPAVRWLISLF
ncbi:MAG TPA: hypothetical protein VFD41_14625 [Actinomycetales bacterium]|nr:hypothetical protein [Actinomycetales bacterium]